MSEFLSVLIATVSADTFANVFIILILVTLMFSILFSITKQAPSFVKNAPNLMTSLGILGTFSGIVVGLMAFNPQDIDDSIALLLSGLKTAFLTSLVGMCASILFKFIYPFLHKKGSRLQNAGPDDIHAVMNEQLETMNMLLAAIGAENETSLVSKVSTLCADVHEGNTLFKEKWKTLNQHNEKIVSSLGDIQKANSLFSDRLWLKMAEFGEMLSKSATEQVINALKEVICDFNNKLSEQFGENFKRLDESVKKLLDWQDNYREQLEDMKQKYQLGVDAISSTERSVLSICKHTQAIPETMDKLKNVMALSHRQAIELEERLEAFKDMRDKAIEAIPQIQHQLNETMSAIGCSVSAASNHYNEMLEGSKEMMDTFTLSHNTANAEFTRVTTDQLEKMKENVQFSVETFASNLTEATTNVGERLTTNCQEISENMGVATKSMQNIASEISSQSVEIHDQLRLSLTDVTEKVSELVTTIKNQTLETSEILVKGNQDLSSSTAKVQEEVLNGINTLQLRFENVLEDVFLSLLSEVKKTFESLDDQVQESVGLTGQAVEKQVKILDKQMLEEVSRVINEMGKGLAAVTQQFTDDYTQLTHEMSKVVRAANKKAGGS